MRAESGTRAAGPGRPPARRDCETPGKSDRPSPSGAALRLRGSEGAPGAPPGTGAPGREEPPPRTGPGPARRLGEGAAGPEPPVRSPLTKTIWGRAARRKLPPLPAPAAPPCPRPPQPQITQRRRGKLLCPRFRGGNTGGTPPRNPSLSPIPRRDAQDRGCVTFNRCRLRRKAAPRARSVRVGGAGAAAARSPGRAAWGWAEALRQPPAATHARGGPRRRHSSRSQREGGSGCGHLREEGGERRGVREGKAHTERGEERNRPERN